MSEQPEPPRTSLNVINPNDKVEQLRRAFAADRTKPTGTDDRTTTSSDLERKVVDALRTVFDPEIPVNIYDLGLVYGIDVAPDRRVTIRMTLTAPGCPVAGMIVADVESKVENISEVSGAKVELVWDPPWDKSRMSEAALLELGLL